MAEFKLGRIRFVWKNNWTTGTTYYKDDVVAFGGKVYICVEGHGSAADFFTDLNIVPSKWNLVSDGQSWLGEWAHSTAYVNNNIVKYGSKLYICQTNHTSSVVTGTVTKAVAVAVNTQSPGNNVYVIDGTEYPSIQFQHGKTYVFTQDNVSNVTHPFLFSASKNGTHSGGTEYTVGVKYYIDNVEVDDSTAYIAAFDAATNRKITIEPTSSTPETLYYYCYNHSNMSIDSEIDIINYGIEADLGNWQTFAEGLDWKGDWNAGYQYRNNDFVKYGGASYVCKTPHTSQANGLEDDQAKWELLNKGFDYRSEWTASKKYLENDVVRYGAGLWISINNHTSSSAFSTDSANWEKFVEGFQFEDVWTWEGSYQTGDVVRYGGNQYIAKRDNTDKTPSLETTDWDLFSEGLRLIGDWGADSSQYEYQVGDVVRLGGFTYRCILDHQNQQPPSALYWERLNSGFEWRGEWVDEQEYYQGDVVRYGDSSYVCLLGHISEGDDYSSNQVGAAGSRPDLADSGAYWSALAIGTEQSVLTTKGDLVYYSGAAPTRLPIGKDGQVLQVNANSLPEWAFLGSSEDVYYVAEHGKDEPAPIYGQSIDRPWKSIRYAAQQVELGAKSPEAAQILELNRKFIQREIVEWTDYQITNNTAPFTSSFSYESSKCERDMGLIVDAILHDIKHGGNVRSREAALSYANETAGSPYLTQKAETVASINYGLSVITNVLAQTDPSVNYQTTNGDNSTAIVSQYKNANLIAEAVNTQVTENIKIITDAITAGNDTNIPPRIINNTLIKVSTGRYIEVLPIIVPAECCIIGDELRAVTVEPRTALNSTLTPTGDFKYTFKGLERMTGIVGDIVTGQTVTATSGNSQAQSQVWPYAETTVVGPEVTRLARSVSDRINVGLGEKRNGNLPLFHDMSDTSAGRARDLVLKNKAFIQQEVIGYIADTYPNLDYSRTKCKQDVGLILDSIAYDLTYGGNWMSETAGLAYYNGASGVLQIDSTESAATIAAYGIMKSTAQTVSRDIAVTPTYQSTTAQVSGIPGDAADATTIGSLFDDIIDIVDNGPSSSSITYPVVTGAAAGLQSAATTLASKKTEIGEKTIDFINNNFGSFKYNSAVCRRDLTNIITDVTFDAAFGTNYNGVYNGISYTRPINAYNLANQRVETIGAIRQARDSVLALTSDSTAITRIRTSMNEIVDIINNNTGPAVPGDGVANALTFPSPAGVDQNKVDAKDNLVANRDFIKADVVAYVNNNTPPAGYDEAKCARDVGYIVDAMCYDVLYGGTMAATRITESYFGIFGAIYPDGQVSETVAAYGHLSTLMGLIAQETSVTAQSGNSEVQTTLGTPASGTEASSIAAGMTIITDALTAGNTDSVPTVVYPSVTGASVSIQSDITDINTARPATILSTIQFITNTYNDFKYDHAKCTRDLGLIIDAAAYDWQLGTNYASLITALSYLRAPSNKVVGDQKTATIAANEFAKTLAVANVNSEAGAITGINTTWEIVQDTLFAGAAEGGNRKVADQEVFNAIRQLEMNKDFIADEVVAYVNDYFSDTITATSVVTGGSAGGTNSNRLTITSTAWLDEGMEVKLTNTNSILENSGLFIPNQKYYVKEIINGTSFTVSNSANGSEVAVDNPWSGSIKIEKAYVYSEAICKRDIKEYINAMKWDLEWAQTWKRQYKIGNVENALTFYRPASYKTRLAARFYVNSIIGSQEEDFYYLRNGTGIRLQSMKGLKGDLGPANSFGTQRPTAGAYCSLDPGWGPDDQRVWITARSPYVQNCTTFGFAATGQRIDGALHNGGNDSIVSNDFTQVISDGIGAHILNNGRAELVSVFTYYSHIGYLAETGGRVRATNGNNSYGKFGSSAEGVDPTEVPVTAVIDNSTQYSATISGLNTNNNELLNIELSHAGNDYTEALIEVFGPGDNEVVVADEFRDGAMFQTRVIETTPDTAGGTGYTLVSNVAQSGSSTYIDLSSTDGNVSSAYVGMRLQVIGGAGIGLFGIIDSYDAGTKRASITKVSDGTAGWDHVVPGTTFAAPNSTSTYQIEPQAAFTAPPQSNTQRSLAGALVANKSIFAETSAEYTALATTTESDGTGVTFDVTRNGEKYYVTLNGAGTGYTRLDTVVIPGTSLNGTLVDNDITVTITTVNSSTGAVVDFDFTGIGRKGLFITIPTSGTGGAKSIDGITWTAETLPSPGAGFYDAIATGLVDDGSSVYKASAVVTVCNNSNVVAYSVDGDAWTGTTLPNGLAASGSKSIAYGNVGVNDNRFIVSSVGDRDIAYSQDAGQTWAVSSNALPSTGFNLLTYGKGLFVALKTGTNTTSFSADGVTWSAGAGLSTDTWTDIVWGNGRFVAIAASGTKAAFSLDGQNWTDATLPTVGAPRNIAYGQGVFVVTFQDDADTIAYSENGIQWSTKTITANGSSGYGAVAFGNPGQDGKFVCHTYDSTSVVEEVKIGAKARGRAAIANQKLFQINIEEPGSGYTSAPTLTITDPNNITDVELQVRIGNGAIANPTFNNRGTSFTTATATVNAENSNGKADFFQNGAFIAVKRLTSTPVPGSNVVIAGIPNKFFKLVSTVSLIGTNDGSKKGFLQVSPSLTISEAPANEASVSKRIRFSQVRLTGHDFLDIGTGNFADTNYPGTPVNAPVQSQETNDFDGGRVFYTATDQDGNFRVGALFSIEQATGVATLDADAFNIAGLQELSLGEVTLGGNSASITEFSTDPFFTANSDTVVPTQRAVKAYIEAQIGGGGASLNVNSVTAGDIFINTNQITTVSGETINIKANVNFSGSVLGLPLAYNYMLR
jgi:hypothetical protein